MAGDPWRMLVVCVLCNMTHGERAYPVALALFERWPTAGAMSAADPSDLPGVGRYARDAWSIFVEGRDDLWPDDGHLVRYVRWRALEGSWAVAAPVG